VYFFDEGRFGAQPTVGRMWARRGRVPRVAVQPGYKNFYLYSAVNPATGDQFTLFLPWVNTAMMNIFLRLFAASLPIPEVLLVVDGAGWHRARDLQVPPGIQVLYLPPYSPELNPVERLWRWLRRQVGRNRWYQEETAQMDALETALRTLSSEALRSLCHCSYL